MKVELTETDIVYLQLGLDRLIPCAGNGPAFERLKSKLAEARALAEQYNLIFLIDEE